MSANSLYLFFFSQPNHWLKTQLNKTQLNKTQPNKKQIQQRKSHFEIRLRLLLSVWCESEYFNISLLFSFLTLMMMKISACCFIHLLNPWHSFSFQQTLWGTCSTLSYFIRVWLFWDSMKLNTVVNHAFARWLCSIWKSVCLEE